RSQEAAGGEEQGEGEGEESLHLDSVSTEMERINPLPHPPPSRRPAKWIFPQCLAAMGEGWVGVIPTAYHTNECIPRRPFRRRYNPGPERSSAQIERRRP